MASQEHLPALFFGTGIFGSSHVPALQDKANVSEFLDSAYGLGISQIDTAARYPNDNPGAAERILGEVNAPLKGFTLNTKVAFTGGSSDGSLSKDAVRKSVSNSLRTLNVDKLGILYAHLPDATTPLEEQAEALNEQYQNGLCEKVGVCNFPPDLLERFIGICEAKGYVKPAVYQGQYNLICREPEKRLIPILRQHNMAFVAYSPLGGGFLTGKLTAGTAQGTRLDSDYGQHFRNWYDKPAFHDAVRDLQTLIQPLGISPAEAALRWLAYHSLLGPTDGIILGASRVEQLRQNAADIKKGPLPEEVVERIAAIKETMLQDGEGNFTVDPSKLPKKK